MALEITQETDQKILIFKDARQTNYLKWPDNNLTRLISRVESYKIWLKFLGQILVKVVDERDCLQGGYYFG